MEMTSQGELPVTLMRAAVRFDVTESDCSSIMEYTVYSFNSLAFKVPKPEDFETFLQERVLGVLCLQAGRPTDKSHWWRRWPWRAQPLLVDAQTRAVIGSSLFTLHKASKAIQTPGATYEVLPREAYLSKEEEDKLHRAGRIPKSGTVELTLDQEDKLIAKGKGVERR